MALKRARDSTGAEVSLIARRTAVGARLTGVLPPSTQVCQTVMGAGRGGSSRVELL